MAKRQAGSISQAAKGSRPDKPVAKCTVPILDEGPVCACWRTAKEEIIRATAVDVWLIQEHKFCEEAALQEASAWLRVLGFKSLWGPAVPGAAAAEPQPTELEPDHKRGRRGKKPAGKRPTKLAEKAPEKQPLKPGRKSR